jgi:hypothetical protein
LFQAELDVGKPQPTDVATAELHRNCGRQRSSAGAKYRFIRTATGLTPEIFFWNELRMV